MITLFIVYFCRINSILFMYFGLFIGSFCTIFILREFYFHSQLRTSLNLLIIIIFSIDSIRALVCAPLETFVLIETWHVSIIYCDEQSYLIEYSNIIIDSCRFTMAVRACFNVVQPFGFIAIAYERLRTVVKRNGNFNMNVNHHQQQNLIRLKNIIIWICISLLLGIMAGIYQRIVYFPSNTCYGEYDITSRAAIIIRLFCIVGAALISGCIYGKIFFMVNKYQKNSITPIVNHANNNNSIENQNKLINDMRRKDLRLAKQSFIIFLSFFLCRLPSVITILVTLIVAQQSSRNHRCYFEEFTNLSIQFTFLATITDPLVYIWSQPKLKKKFSRFSIISVCFTNTIQE